MDVVATKKKSVAGATKQQTGRYVPAIRVYASDEQRAEIERKANLLGLSASSYLLMAGLERPERPTSGGG